MGDGEARSLNSIKRETEATRANLTGTVEQLRSTVTDTATEIRDRLRPDAIKAEVSGYIKSRGEHFLSDITEAARRNPMQAVAVGASVAYPLIRFARAIPMPILMIGAGLFFAGSKTGRDLTQKASDTASDLVDETRKRSLDLGDQVLRSASGAKEYATDALNRAGSALAENTQRFRPSAEVTDSGTANDDVASTVKQTASTVGASIGDRVGDLKNRSADLAKGAVNAVQDTAKDTASTIRESAVDTVQAGRDLLRSARERVVDTGQGAAQTMRETISQNPLLVAGVGLLVGGLIASALPKLEAEDNLLGEASTAVKRRAQEAASRGFETAKGAADDILTNVAQQAEKEGLTHDGIAEGASDVRTRLKRVAERAVTKAFEQENQNQQSGGADHHG